MTRRLRDAGFRTLLVTTLLALALTVAGCGRISVPNPFARTAPTATATPLPTPTPLPPTATPVPASDGDATGAAAVIPTPQVTIPEGFDPVVDTERGYSLALPNGWTALDLRGQQLRTMANTFGMGDALAPLNDFLAGPEGQAIGVVYVTDLSGMIFGGLPTLLNVSVVDAPNVTSDALVEILEAQIQANAGALGQVAIRDLTAMTVNNLPGVQGAATVDLSGLGVNATLFGKVTAILANDRLYVLTLATQEGSAAEKEPLFDQIIGTFRPE